MNNNLDVTLASVDIERQPKKSYKITLNTMGCLLNSILLTMIFIELSTVCIFGLVYINDLTVLIRDAKINMKDLSKLLPEVSDVLLMVKQICSAPEYSDYCGLDNITAKNVF